MTESIEQVMFHTTDLYFWMIRGTESTRAGFITVLAVTLPSGHRDRGLPRVSC
jgi:hypothetical protein